MTDQEVADFLSKGQKRPVALTEAEEVHRDLKALAEIMIDSYFGFKKKGLIDAKGKIISTEKALTE